MVMGTRHNNDTSQINEVVSSNGDANGEGLMDQNRGAECRDPRTEQPNESVSGALHFNQARNSPRIKLTFIVR